MEWIGYLASVVLLASFMMKEIRILRMVNTAGCALFVVYGFSLQFSWPIIITNVAIMGINAYHLFKPEAP